MEKYHKKTWNGTIFANDMLYYWFYIKNCFNNFNQNIQEYINRSIIRIKENNENLPKKKKKEEKKDICSQILRQKLHTFQSCWLWKSNFKLIKNWNCFYYNIFAYVRNFLGVLKLLETLAWNRQIFNWKLTWPEFFFFIGNWDIRASVVFAYFILLMNVERQSEIN